MSYDPDDMACMGAATREIPQAGTTFEECIACRAAVRWDLIDHPFFGFQHCRNKRPAPATDVIGSEIEEIRS